jgi:hypothetical protein
VSWFTPINLNVRTARQTLRLSLICTALLVGSAVSGFGATIITDAFVEAVAQIESGGGRQTIGDGGKAIGWWQMHEPAWQDASDFRARKGLPTWSYENTHDPEVARLYARDYLTILESQLRNAFGENVTVEMIYAAYNIGFGRFQSRDFLIEKTPATTQAACARLKQLITASASPAEKTTELTTAE